MREEGRVTKKERERIDRHNSSERRNCQRERERDRDGDTNTRETAREPKERQTGEGKIHKNNNNTLRKYTK